LAACFGDAEAVLAVSFAARDHLASLIRDIIGIALLAVAFMGCTPLATGPKWIRQDRRFNVSAEPLGELAPGRGPEAVRR
jgi:hypothetical protein